jgi:uncharacterized membrane protein
MMNGLIAASVSFVLIHRLISGAPWRGRIAALVGERTLRAVFSLVSLLNLVWLIAAYAGVHEAGGGAPPWADHAPTRIALAILQLLAVFLIVAGVWAPNPTIVGQGDVARDPNVVRGLVRVTRHPFLWGVTLFSVGHLLVRHDVASQWMFGVLIFVALSGMISIDAKRRRALGAAWQTFAAETSVIPFAAILTGRQKFRPGEIAWRSVLASVALWGALLIVHPFLSGGARALP